MRTLILSALLMSTALFSQDLKKGDHIRLQVPVQVIADSTVIINGGDQQKATHLADRHIYKVVAQHRNSVDLKARPYSKRSNAKAALYNNKIYRVRNVDLTEAYDEQLERLSIGIATLPFKYRPQGKETFETEFNINTTLNIYLFTLGRGNLNFQFGTGFGSIRLDETNSNLWGENAISALTLGGIGGFMIQYKSVQFGIYSGVDIINNNDRMGWTHNGKPWLGLGIGFKLFTIDIGN